jgi:hypothetical protein
VIVFFEHFFAAFVDFRLLFFFTAGLITFGRGVVPYNLLSDFPEVLINVFEFNGPEGIGSMLVWSLNDSHVLIVVVISIGCGCKLVIKFGR